MKDDLTSELFLYLFLASKGALDAYVKNRVNENEKGFAIIYAFVWFKTNEGYHYWKRLSLEFTELPRDTAPEVFERYVSDGELKMILEDNSKVFIMYKEESTVHRNKIKIEVIRD